MGQSISSFYEYTDMQYSDDLTNIADQVNSRTFFHVANAQQTKEHLSLIRNPDYIISATLNSIDREGRTPLHGADYDKTKAVLDAIPQNKREGFVRQLISKKTTSQTVPSTVLENPYGIITPQFKAKTKMILDCLPTGSNIMDNVLRLSVKNNPDMYKDHIATPKDLSDLFMGVSRKSEKLKKDFQGNMPKYISYASDIVKNTELMGELNENEKKALNIANDTQNKQASYIQRDLEKKETPISNLLKKLPGDVKIRISSFLTKDESSPSILDEVYKQKTTAQKRKTFVEGIKSATLNDAKKQKVSHER